MFPSVWTCVVWLEHVLAISTLLWMAIRVYRHGFMKTVGTFLLRTVRAMPGVGGMVNRQLETYADGMMRDNFAEVDSFEATTTLPKQRTDPDKVLQQVLAMRQCDVDGEKGQTFAYIYSIGEQHNRMLKEIYNSCCQTNALNPTAFPSLRKMEVEVVAMACNLLHGDSDTCGTMTSGGTESIMLAVKTYRDRAREMFPHITEPEMVLPISAHPAFEKAGSFLDVKRVYARVDPETFAVSVQEMESLITRNTIFLVGSAPQYPQGVMDPIEALSEIALRHRLPLHVDACVGGFLLPWVKKLGFMDEKFDYELPAVTSISLDVHKYGYSAKGASVITYRNDDDYRRFQFFAYSQWPGGLFVSPSFAGTRAGGPIAGAWATLKALGEEGYLENTKVVMEATHKMMDAVSAIPELRILGRPRASLFAFTSEGVNIHAVADCMEKRGWRMERQQFPDCLHCSVTPPHLHTCSKFANDLRESVEHVKKHPELSKTGNAAIYGTVARIPDGAVVEDFLTMFFRKVFRVSHCAQ